MLASVLIIAVSTVMLLYWFRYTCLLLLQGDEDVSIGSEADSGLAHLQLKSAEPDPLQRALDRDYAVLTYVLRHAAGITLNPVERHMLTADYRLMRFWYRMTKTNSPEMARKALEEMSSIVCLLDRRIGAHATSRA